MLQDQHMQQEALPIKNSSINYSKIINSFADLIADEEINTEHITTTKDYFLKIGKELEKNNIKKTLISRITISIIENRMYLKLKDDGYTKNQCRVSPSTYRYHSMVMKAAGYTDSNYHNHTQKDDAIHIMKDYPAGEEYKILELLSKISENNYNIITQLQKKLIYDKELLLKNQTSKVDAVINTRLEKSKRLINTRREIIKKEIVNFSKNNIQKTKTKLLQLISQQNKLCLYFDDRSSITQWQKITALLSIMIGYEKNDIARFLNVTAKHIKLNIYDNQEEILLLLKWFDRCPNPDCGVNLSELYYTMIDEYRKGTPINNVISKIDDFELETLIATGYQKENLKLVIENKKLKDKIGKMKN